MHSVGQLTLPRDNRDSGKPGEAMIAVVPLKPRPCLPAARAFETLSTVANEIFDGRPLDKDNFVPQWLTSESSICKALWTLVTSRLRISWKG